MCSPQRDRYRHEADALKAFFLSSHRCRPLTGESDKIKVHVSRGGSENGLAGGKEGGKHR
jgi:hypothetical protein